MCINPNCSQPDHPDNANKILCQSCGCELILHGRYHVIRLLSDDSGFSNVYEAYAEKTPKILKILKQERNEEPKEVELFEQERYVLEKLNHPGIPKVDDYFQFMTENGQLLHCLVMEKIEGFNLVQWLKHQGNQPISQKQALVWLKQLAEILH
ncbi:MAG: protein kinase, partial [Moorea sp. SIO2B7]|nr:protein kinase [Moorena sp. SIO2B7]